MSKNYFMAITPDPNFTKRRYNKGDIIKAKKFTNNSLYWDGIPGHINPVEYCVINDSWALMSTTEPLISIVELKNNEYYDVNFVKVSTAVVEELGTFDEIYKKFQLLYPNNIGPNVYVIAPPIKYRDFITDKLYYIINGQRMYIDS